MRQILAFMYWTRNSLSPAGLQSLADNMQIIPQTVVVWSTPSAGRRSILVLVNTMSTTCCHYYNDSAIGCDMVGYGDSSEGLRPCIEASYMKSRAAYVILQATYLYHHYQRPLDL